MTAVAFLVLAPLALSVLVLLAPGLVFILTPLTCALSTVVAWGHLNGSPPFTVDLLGPLGVAVLIDSTTAWFILTNAAVFAAVFLYLQRKKDRYSGVVHALVLILHAGVNACFISHDLFNLYVAIELTTIAAFLLIIQPLGERHHWNGLRYLLVSNIGMLFYLIGVVMVYDETGSFNMTALASAHPVSAALIVGGLMVKGGVFLPGFWLPKAHAEADSPVSALLSGVVVKIGVLPLVKFAMMSQALSNLVKLAGTAGAVTGILFGLFQKDIKRLLACSTLSQIGFILAAPVAAGIYAFAHGVAKASLFLCAGSAPSRDVNVLRRTGLPAGLWWMMLPAALSLIGFPMFAGFGAKTLAFNNLADWQQPIMTVLSAGTVIIVARFAWVPVRFSKKPAHWPWEAPLLLSLVVLGVGAVTSPFSVGDCLKAFVTLFAGATIHFLGGWRLARIDLPGRLERFEDLMGLTAMSLLALMIIGSRQ
jgi:multicomponent Na+:H+ antiporter subunit D